MRFDYLRAGSVEEALELLRENDGDCRVLAGGTDLLVMIQEKLVSPRAVLDISGLEELKGIEESGGRIRVGALASHARIAGSAVLEKKAAPLVQSCAEVGSPQIRALGTIGGNLVMASPSGDAIPALFVLGASVILKSSRGERAVPIEEFFTGVKRSVRRPDELLTAVVFPAPAPSDRGFFKKLGQRKALAISKVSTAALLSFRGGGVEKIRVALGAVAPTVIRAPRTESFLAGHKLTADPIEEAARICAEESRAITDLRSSAVYRNRMAGLLLARGLEELVEEN
ncbi:MAG: xanthine dehydrogenase family protein subunit M [PVC group bacterium]